MSKATPEQSNINDLEAAKFLLDEWKFRQQHCWNSLRQYGLAAVTVSIVPYLKIDIFGQLGKVVLVFPAVGWLLALAAVWLFAAEYVRCYPVEHKYQELLFRYYPPKPTLTSWKMVLEKKIGWSTIYIFLIGFTALALMDGILLWILQERIATIAVAH